MRNFTFILITFSFFACQGTKQTNPSETVVTEQNTIEELPSYKDLITEHRKNVDTDMKNGDHSPIDKDSLANFEELNYFTISEDWNIRAQYTLIDTGKIFDLPTTTDRVIPMKKHGLITFTRNNKTINLFAYTYVEHPDEDLFVPFLDATNGDLTYGGGRYVEVKYPINDSVWIDFNKAYNPYCAYNHHYSCPIPPLENTIDIVIDAGEKILYTY